MADAPAAIGEEAMRLARMLQAVDAHAAGEPGRVIVGGVLDVPGATMLEKARHLEAARRLAAAADAPRAARLPGLCANVILPPTHPEAQAGYVIMEHVEYPGMSGTNTICVVTALLETGMLPMTEPVTELVLEAPAGLIRVRATCAGRQGHRRDVPQRAGVRDPPRRADRGPGLGTVVVDVAYGGMFYVIADAEALGFRLVPDEGRDITRVTREIRPRPPSSCRWSTRSSRRSPGSRSGSCRAPRTTRANSWRNVVTLSTGDAGLVPAVDVDGGRSTGRRAAPGRAPRWRPSTHGAGLGSARTSATRGSSGTVFTGRLVEETRVGERTAVVPTLTGTAWITGFASYVVDPTDPFPEGFTVGDIW